MKNIANNQGISILSIGSNLGNREKYLSSALELLEKRVGNTILISGVYETEPWGYSSQPSFLNRVVVLESTCSALALLSELQKIELVLERVRELHWGMRTIDLDILYHNNEVISTKKLVIPHPYIAQRRFVLMPLHEIIPNFEHPLLKKTHTQLLQQCRDNGKVNLLFKEK